MAAGCAEYIRFGPVGSFRSMIPDRWSLGGGRIFLKTALPPQEVIRRLRGEIDGPEPFIKRPLSGVFGDFSGTAFRLVSYGVKGTAYRRKLYGKVELSAEGSIVSGAFRLNAGVRGLLTAIVVIIWLTALATALHMRSIQPVGVAILATVIGWVGIYLQTERSRDGEMHLQAFLIRTLDAKPIDNRGANP